MKIAAILGSALAASALHAAAGWAQSAPAAAPGCGPVGDLHFVCGLINVEDFLPVDGGRWLVGGSYKAGSAGLYLIDTAAKTAQPVALSLAATPDPLYAGCPAPDLKGLSTHGLEIRPGAGGTTTVYAINHGGRESVEVFRLAPTRNAAEWIGCIALPAGTSSNSIAALPGGALAITKFLDTGDKNGIRTVMSRQINGLVYRWTPGKGLDVVPGSQLSGDNGIVASPDGQWLYINAYGTKEVVRIPISGQGERASVAVDFYPDNLRWAPDGKIFVTGQFLDPNNLAGRHGWATVRLDPKTMTTTPVVKEPGLAEFDDATSGVQVGDALWFGTFRGDRVAWRPAP